MQRWTFQNKARGSMEGTRLQDDCEDCFWRGQVVVKPVDRQAVSYLLYRVLMELLTYLLFCLLNGAEGTISSLSFHQAVIDTPLHH